MKIFLLLALACGFCNAASFIQGASSNGANVNTGVLVTAPVIGHSIYMTCFELGSGLSGATVVNVTDDHGNAYTNLYTNYDVGDGVLETVSAATVTATGANLTATCTPTTGTVNFSTTDIGEYAGTTNVLDVASNGHNNGGASTGTCGALTTTNANDLVLYYVYGVTGTVGWSVTVPPTGFTVRANYGDGQTGLPVSYMDRFLSATAAMTFTLTWADTSAIDCIAVAVKQAAASPAGFGSINTPQIF
jgi:hypothetical protein